MPYSRMSPFIRRHLVLLLLSIAALGLLSYFGVIERLAQHLALSQIVVVSAIILIPINGFMHIAIRYVPSNTQPVVELPGIIFPRQSLLPGCTLIAINLGGALLPLTYSLLLVIHLPISLWSLLAITIITTLSSYALSRPIPGLGIGLPLFSVPVIAALTTHFIVAEHVVSTAYIAGTIGVMLGADVLRVNDIKQLGVSFVSIGGAGVLDSIVLTGFIAALLALLL